MPRAAASQAAQRATAPGEQVLLAVLPAAWQAPAPEEREAQLAMAPLAAQRDPAPEEQVAQLAVAPLAAWRAPAPEEQVPSEDSPAGQPALVAGELAPPQAMAAGAAPRAPVRAGASRAQVRPVAAFPGQALPAGTAARAVPAPYS